jgi:hypothetical protein
MDYDIKRQIGELVLRRMGGARRKIENGATDDDVYDPRTVPHDP